MAQTRNQAALKEGGMLLSPCGVLAADDRSRCKGNQDDFLESWLRARAGQAYYMTDIVDFLGTEPPHAVRYPGISPAWREGAAWQIVQEDFTPDPCRKHILHGLNADRARRASPADNQAIEQRAAQIAQQIRHAPSVAPAPPSPNPFPLACQ